MISYEDFKKLDLVVGTVKSAESIEDADRLLKLLVDIGEEEPRQLVAGIAEQFEEPEELVGLQVVVLSNLEPKELFGVESRGMVLAADEEGKPILLSPRISVPAGTSIK